MDNETFEEWRTRLHRARTGERLAMIADVYIAAATRLHAMDSRDPLGVEILKRAVVGSAVLQLIAEQAKSPAHYSMLTLQSGGMSVQELAALDGGLDWLSAAEALS